MLDLQRTRLLVFADPSDDSAGWQRLLRALAGAARAGEGVAFVLRAKAVPPARRRLFGRALVDAIGGAPLIVHSTPDLARDLRAAGLHLPEASPLSLSAARAASPRRCVFGASRHDAAGLAQAQAEGFDYCTLSPVGEVPGKNPPIGVASFGEACAAFGGPVFALGGVTPELAKPLEDAGAHGLAVTRAVVDAAKPEAAARALMAPWRHR